MRSIEAASPLSPSRQPAPKEIRPSPLRCLSIIVPVYNEVFTIKRVLQRIQEVPLPKEIIIVDDASTDGTREALKALNEDASAGIKIVFHERNKGKGAAIRTGIRHAEGDITLIQDADLEYNPAEYPRLIEPILAGDADVVYGSRFRGERARVLFFWHSLGNKILTTLSNICTNLNLTDMETCYKVFRTEIIKALPLRSHRFGFEPEVTAKVAKLRCRIYEVPISYRGRSAAEGKKINWKDGLAAIFTILKYFFVDDLYEETAGLRTLRIMEGAGKYNEWLFSQCRPHLGRRVLEMGSGVGNITKYLLDRETVVATDIIDFYLEELSRSFQGFSHVHVHKLNLLDRPVAEDLADRYKPDCVLSMNVLEHIEKDALALENVNRLLPLDGRLVLVVPAHGRLFSAMDSHLGHFRRYDKNGMTRLLKGAGFELDESRYLNMVGAIGWFTNGRIFRRKLIPSRQVRAFDALVKTLALEKHLRAPFGLSLLTVAHKVRNI